MEDIQSDKLIEWAFEWLKTAEAFAVEQAPLLVQEFYMWFTAVHIMGILFWILILFGTFAFHIICSNPEYSLSDDEGWYARMKRRWGRDLYDETDDVVAIPIGIVTFIGALGVIYNTYNLVYILVAPRLYLIDKLIGF